MAAWIGLIGVVAGALLAFCGQYLNRKLELLDRRAGLLLEQAAVIVSMSEDFRNRVWAERNNLATDAVQEWDYGAYRLAEARLLILCRTRAVVAAIHCLRKSGHALDNSWRLPDRDESEIDAAWQSQRLAIDRFIEACSRAFPRNGFHLGASTENMQGLGAARLEHQGPKSEPTN